MKTFQSKPLNMSDISFNSKKIDIIIPFYGQYEKVYRLVKQIWNSVKCNSYQIFLVDDCSPNKTYSEVFTNAPYTKIKRHDKQMGFGASLNTGFNETYNEYVVFMHSDCFIEDPHWLKELLLSYLNLQKQGGGLVSARTNNPGEGTDPQLKANRNQKDQDIIVTEESERGPQGIPLYCAICERSLFQIIKGFIKPYPYGFYEDTEIFYRMKKYNLKQGISGKSWVGHEGGATFKALLKKKPEIQKTIDANREICIRDIKSLGTT
jgi:glycosyltransferase involved in cell wall biosynthesis